MLTIYTLFFLRGRRCALPRIPSRLLNLGRSFKNKANNQFASDWPAKPLTLKHFTETTLGDWFFSAGMLNIRCFPCGGGAAPSPAPPPALFLDGIATAHHDSQESNQAPLFY